MATPTTINGFQAKRNNLFSIPPKALHVDWSKNLSRNGEEPPVDEALIELAKDMMPRKGNGEDEDGTSGQLNPITVRKNSDGKYEVILGYRRMRAALWLVESGTCPDFEISYVTKSMNDAEAALMNMSENLQREDPKPIQTAHAIRKLTEDMGMSLSQVAGRLKKSPTWCSNLLKLVTLPKAIQESIEKEEIGVTVGLELAKLPAESQNEVMSDLSKGDKITASKVKEKSGEAAKTPLGKLKKFLTTKHMADEGGSILAEMILQFLDKEVTEQELGRHWDATFEMLSKQLNDEKAA